MRLWRGRKAKSEGRNPRKEKWWVREREREEKKRREREREREENSTKQTTFEMYGAFSPLVKLLIFVIFLIFHWSSEPYE